VWEGEVICAVATKHSLGTDHPGKEPLLGARPIWNNLMAASGARRRSFLQCGIQRQATPAGWPSITAGRRTVITSSGRCWLRSGPRPQSCGQLAGLYFYTSPPTSRTYYSAADRVILDRQALAPLSAAACRAGSVILAAKPIASHRAEGERRESWPGRSGCRRCPRSGFRAGDGHQPWIIQRSGTR
jgi:hypothetical protein